MLPPGYEEGTSNFVLAVGSADASGHEAAPAAAIDTLSLSRHAVGLLRRARAAWVSTERCARGVAFATGGYLSAGHGPAQGEHASA
jgi:hypothetical protein